MVVSVYRYACFVGLNWKLRFLSMNGILQRQPIDLAYQKGPK